DPHVCETVRAVAGLLSPDRPTCTSAEVASVLGLSPPGAWYRVKKALRARYLVNNESRKGQPAKQIGRASCRERGWRAGGGRRRHTRSKRDWSSDVCSSDLDPHVCETVRAVAGLLSPDRPTCTSAEVASVLGLSPPGAWYRVKKALRARYLVNNESRKGQPAK